MSTTIRRLIDGPSEEKQNTIDNCDAVCVSYEKELPVWITGTLFQDGEGKKNKKKNSNKLVAVKGQFMGRKTKDSKHWSIPCKALLYDSEEKLIEKRFFDSLKECHEKAKLTYKQIRDSMNDSYRILYFEEWIRNVWYAKNKKGFPLWAYDNTYFIRICAVTPPMQETVFGRSNNYNY